MTAGFPRKVFMSVDAVGGVWTYALELAAALASEGVEIDLAVLGPPPSETQRARAVGVPGLRLSVTGLALDWTAKTEAELDRIAWELREAATACGADLVHLNAPAHAGFVQWDLPLAVAAHSCVATWWRAVRGGPLPPDLAWRAARTAAGLSIAGAIIAPSRSFARQLADVYGSRYHIDAVYNARQHAAPATPSTRDCVLTAGRLWDPAKNAAVIDQAAMQLKQPIFAAGPAGGPNGEAAHLPNLTLLGSLSEAELADWYARTAVFVSMSKYEPFGLSVLEGAQAGAALVLCANDTFAELWHDAAYFVPPDDADALAHAIDTLTRNNALRSDLALRASRRAQHYGLKRKLEGTLHVYRRALARRELATIGSAA
jgi:glycosyltransferase involved in cell wall biosynthesis